VFCVRWYLRFSLSFWNLQKNDIRAQPHRRSRYDLALRQRYAPELNRRSRPELRNINRSWRVMKHISDARKWTFISATRFDWRNHDLLLSAERDAAGGPQVCSRTH
jgi:hypothetical protein